MNSITIQFNKAADDSVKAGTEPMFNMDGKPIVMSGLFKRRMKAQMDRSTAAERYAKARMKK